MKNLTQNLLVLSLFISTSLFVRGAQAQDQFKDVTMKTIEYKDGDTVLEGAIAYPTHFKSKKLPGLVVVHDWLGLGANTKMRIQQLAELGYIAFAADIYGKGVRPTQAEAPKIAGLYKGDRKLLRKRINLAVNELLKQPNVDQNRTAAMGYCFGGTTVLELARSGANLKGFITFHGGLDTPTPTDAANIKGEVLVLHGADDPFVTSKDVDAFEKEMKDAKVKWELVKYSGAVHSFTIREAGNDNTKGAAYNKDADEKSWEEMKMFLNRIFK